MNPTEAKQLIEDFKAKHGAVRLNFGCGTSQVLDSYLNFDLHNPTGDPRIHELDLEKPLPLDSNSVDHIRIHGTLEHLVNWIQLMQEMYRTLKPQGTVDISVPNYATKTMFNDPTHRSFFTEVTFRYFDRDWAVGVNDGYYGGLGCNFKIVSLRKTGKKYNFLRKLRFPADPIEFMGGNIEVMLRADKP